MGDEGWMRMDETCIELNSIARLIEREMCEKLERTTDVQTLRDASAHYRAMYEVLEKCRVFAANVSAFLSRDAGTPRIDQTASGLARVAVNQVAEITITQQMQILQKKSAGAE